MNRTQRLENQSAALDGELSVRDESTLSAWLEIHPEDRREFEPISEVVGLLRGLPEVEPPSGLADAIKRAVAKATPVDVDRETALTWLDDYFENELGLAQRQVIEHYLLVDADFAEKARLHAAMFSALHSVGEADPPADLAIRIRAASARSTPDRGARGHDAQRGAPLSLPRPAYAQNQGRGWRRVGAAALAMAASFALTFQFARGTGPTPLAPTTTPAPIVSAPVTPPPSDPGTPPVVEHLVDSELRQPAAPANTAPQPAPSTAATAPAPRAATPVPAPASAPATRPTAPARRLSPDDAPRTPPPPRNVVPAPNVQEVETQSAVPPAGDLTPAAEGTAPVRRAPAEPAPPAAVASTPPPAAAPIEAGQTGLAAESERQAPRSVETGTTLSSPPPASSPPNPDRYRQIEVPPF